MSELRLDLDHIGILGPDIEALAADFRSLGFTVVGPAELTAIDSEGVARGLGQFSAHVMFADSYIELTAVPDPAPDHHLRRFLSPPWGIRLLILACRDAAASRDRCAAAGLAPGTVQRARRRIGYGRTGDACFKWFALADDAWPEALVAFVEHETPDLVFQAEVARHANGAVGLTQLFLRAGVSPERFRPLAAENGLRLRVLDAAETGTAAIAGAGLRVANLAKTAALLDANGIRYENLATGLRLQLDCGVRLEFSEAPL